MFEAGWKFGNMIQGGVFEAIASCLKQWSRRKYDKRTMDKTYQIRVERNVEFPLSYTRRGRNFVIVFEAIAWCSKLSRRVRSYQIVEEVILFVWVSLEAKNQNNFGRAPIETVSDLFWIEL